MTRSIVIAADEELACPKCGHHYPLDQGITRQTIERYEADFEATLRVRRQEIEESLAKEAERKASRQFGEQLKALADQVEAAKKAEQDARAQTLKAQEDAKARARADFDLEKQALEKDLSEKDMQLRTFREGEIVLRQEKQGLEEARQSLQLDLQRKFDDERIRIREEIGRKEAERTGLIEAEYKKKIEDAQRANEELRRKLEQGSQQLQGEVLELELERTLETSFHYDQIEEVKKGQRGADLIQTVRVSNGEVCGRIIWEAKRAENWSDKWLTKLKDDQQEAQADFAVLVTTAMPKGITEPFSMIGALWVVAPHLVRPVAETLRATLIEINKLRLVNTGRSEKMELLFNYLSGTSFTQRVRTMLESTEAMRHDLEAEKRAMQRIWAKRQGQIERVTNTMATVVGDINAIARDAIPALETIDQLALPGDTEIDG